ncbi:hypothetical protein Bca4012_001713 [Brassica carinata]|uniref:Uncharacterized protein n=1 Tax=Brassica carinata TaxID=52824 RepID=A0A8X7RZC9_BRACI|nr:hypothetical protein Bca52824_043471 [Brassica carinata]
MAATARGNDSGASGQATTTRAQPRGRLEAERDKRRSWQIVDSRLWRAWTGALMVERSQIECGQGEEEEVGAHLLAGLQRSMTMVTGRRSERRELTSGLAERRKQAAVWRRRASGWSHWVVQTTKALDT